jgi:hypothetical protein
MNRKWPMRCTPDQKPLRRKNGWPRHLWELGSGSCVDPAMARHVVEGHGEEIEKPERRGRGASSGSGY